MKLTRRQYGGAGEIEEDEFWKKLFETEDMSGELGPLREGSFMYKLFSTVVKNLNKKIEKAEINSRVIIAEFDKVAATQKVQTITSDPAQVATLVLEAGREYLRNTDSQRKSVEKYSSLIEIYKRRIQEYTFPVNDNSDKYKHLALDIMESINNFRKRDFPGNSPDIIFVRRQIYNIIMRFVNGQDGIGLLKSSIGCIMITGPPGVGKTQLANSIANIFYRFGILHRRNMNVDPSISISAIDHKPGDFAGSLVGETTIKTNEILYNNLESTLLIDETYAISGDNYSGPKFCDAIVAFTEPNNGIEFIITAGYSLEMKYRFLNVNIGLDRRFETKIRLFPWGLDSFISGRIIKELDKPTLYDGNDEIKNFIIGTSCLMIGSIYFDVKSFNGCNAPDGTPDDEKDKYFNNYFSKKLLKYLPPNDGVRTNYKSNLYPIYEKIMDAPSIKNREILSAYIFKQLGIPVGMLLKSQQADINKLISLISSHPIISSTAIDQLTGDVPDIDALSIINEIYSTFLLTITEGSANISIDETDENIFQVNVIIPANSSVEIFNSKIQEYVDKLSNPEEADILFSNAVANFKGIYDRSIELARTDRANIGDSRVPPMIDTDYLDMKASELNNRIEKHNRDNSIKPYLQYYEPANVPVPRRRHNITLKKR
jgi:hypothetical protein